jgi:hypothetical protein
MEIITHTYHQTSFSGLKVFAMRTLRFLQTTYLLQLMSIASIALFFISLKAVLFLIKNAGTPGQMLLFGYLTAYFFTLIFFSQLDARSRYQNYKLVKDKFYEYGFDIRLLKPFVYSRCQRDAIAVAVREMHFSKEWRQFTGHLGFRWYHILPYLVVRNPGMLFTRDYWAKTLFVKTYRSKYFLW